MKISNLLFFALLSATLTFTACDNDDDDQMAGDGTINLMMDYKVGDEDLELGKVYNINGTAVQIDLANFYMGGITLMPEMDDEELEAISLDQHLLITPEAGMQQLTDAAAGHYHMMNFYVGVDEAINSQTEDDFTSRPADDPLSIQIPAMHWNWNAGYRFVRIDGQVDTDGDGTPDEPMEFHLGTNPYRTDVSVMIHKDVEGDDNMIHLAFDVAQFFEGVDLATEYVTHTFDKPELAQKIQDNIPAAISTDHE